VGLRVDGSGLSDFMWKINGEVLNHRSCFFEGCSEQSQTNVAYFPVLEEKGKRYTVNLTAIKQSTGEKINISRTFVVVDPTVKISSADEKTCRPVILGKYIGLDGREWTDYSDLNFWALTGNSIRLSVVPSGFSPAAKDYSWLVDGVEINSQTATSAGFNIDDKGVLTLPSKGDGESYNVSVGAIYSQSNLIKSALSKHWNVNYDQLFEKPVNDSVIITMQNFAPVLSETPAKKIFATVSASLPSYFAFLLRIFLTGFLLLATSGFILSFFPRLKNEN
jgi:hypothetical protein